jgi:hypothetical protein
MENTGVGRQFLLLCVGGLEREVARVIRQTVPAVESLEALNPGAVCCGDAGVGKLLLRCTADDCIPTLLALDYVISTLVFVGVESDVPSGKGRKN